MQLGTLQSVQHINMNFYGSKRKWLCKCKTNKNNNIFYIFINSNDNRFWKTIT